MSDNYLLDDYKVFDMFKNDWALVTAGTLDDYNSCTVGWGGLGTLWTRPGKNGATVTVYIHPARYTEQFFEKYPTFTVSFYSKEYKKALGYMGSHSGRNEDKAKNCGLTPVEVGGSVSFEEAKLTFVCKKLYAHQFVKEDLAQEIQDYYAANPTVYSDGQGEWEPHVVFVGEVLEVEKK
jgi:flavin reductase (DIM6/NTAB) family NADH-FMN oxidoreductase RutF